MFRKTQVSGVLLISGALFFAAGCGYKTKPTPPDSIVPTAIEDLRYSVEGSDVVLYWTYPRETIKGTDLTDISAFDVYRAVVPLDDYCASCPIPFVEVIKVPGGVVDPEKDRQATYRTSILSPGHKYFYKVNARTSWWAAGADSNVVSFVWHTPAKGAEGLNARAADGEAVISWQPVTMLVDGSSPPYPVEYQVMRSRDGKNYAKATQVTGSTAYTDTGLINGKDYFYRVQSVMMIGDNPVFGETSDTVLVSPVDRTPPGPPTGMEVVQTAEGIKVFWDRSREADVTGYRVYRRMASEKKGTLIGEVPAVQNIFVDKDTAESAYYSVTSIDQAVPPNESVKSREVTTRH